MSTQKNSSGVVIVLTTETNTAVADNLAEQILKRKLAACVSLREVQSHFWWKGKLDKNKEVQLMIKTREEILTDLFKIINQFHSYKTPEILYWKISASTSYKEWIKEVTC